MDSLQKDLECTVDGQTIGRDPEVKQNEKQIGPVNKWNRWWNQNINIVLD